jgi:hypothetical protein
VFLTTSDYPPDEAVVTDEAPNKGRQLLAEFVEGRASPKGNSRQAAVVRTLGRITTSIRLAAVRQTARGLKTARRPTFDPREEAGASDHDFFATGTGIPGIFTLTALRRPH